MQALITPDVDAGFPSFDFFRYFIGHASIIIAVLYTVIVKKIRIGWPDFLNAIIYAQGYLVAVHMINQILSSNYGYTMQKPPGASRHARISTRLASIPFKMTQNDRPLQDTVDHKSLICSDLRAWHMRCLCKDNVGGSTPTKEQKEECYDVVKTNIAADTYR